MTFSTNQKMSIIGLISAAIIVSTISLTSILVESEPKNYGVFCALPDGNVASFLGLSTRQFIIDRDGVKIYQDEDHSSVKTFQLSPSMMCIARQIRSATPVARSRARGASSDD